MGKHPNRWVSQATLPSHLPVGFHRLFTVKPTFTFKDQSSQHMGLSDCTQSSHLTAGFIRLSSQRLLKRSNTTRHSQANRWVYQPTSQAIFLVGFIRLLRQWAGRTVKLVSSSTELRTPSQDLYGLAFPTTYTPNTRKCPLLYSTVPQATPSLPMLFRMCIASLPATLILS